MKINNIIKFKQVKNKVLLVLVALAAAFLITTGCNKDKDDGPKMQMTMTFQSDRFDFFLDGEGPVTIDWGDGSEVETRELDPYDVLLRVISRKYTVSALRTVTVTGENITHLICSGKELINLDVSKNTALTELTCVNCKLTNLDVSKNTALIRLDCKRNQLTSLDVSKNTALTRLDCYDNQLTSLDISKNTALASLGCSINQLTSLDVSNNTALYYLALSLNQFTSDALNALFGTLRNVSDGLLIIRDNPGSADCDPSIAEEKGWCVS